MDIHVHIHHEHDEQLITRLDRLQRSIHSLGGIIINQGDIMAGELDALQAEVERNTSVDQSIIVLVDGLATKIEQLKNDPVKLQAFADTLKASSDAVADKVRAHTPAEVLPGEPPIVPTP